MKALNELQLAKELIKFPSITPTRCWYNKIFREKIEKNLVSKQKY